MGTPLLTGKCERQQHARAQERYAEAQQSAQAGKQNTLGKQLADDAAALRTERGADGNFGAAAHAADEQQIGNVGAGYEKNESGDPRQQVQDAPCTRPAYSGCRRHPG